MKPEIDLTAWNNYLSVKGLSAKTIDQYNQYLNKIIESDFTQETIMQFIRSNNNSIARAMIRNLLMYIQLYQSNEALKTNCHNIIVPTITGRKKRLLKDIVLESEVHKLAKATILRNQIMIFLSFYCALRDSELCGQYAVTPNNFNFDSWISNPNKSGILKVKGKGNKERKVFVPNWLMDKIKYYCVNEISKKQSRNDPLFNIGVRRWQYILATISKNYINRHIHPHSLRHGGASFLRSKGWAIDEIKEFLGHENISTTNIYAHIDITQLEDKYNKTIISDDSK